jgi:glycosyltransferase involved in cell wall biosynthesis
MKMPSISVAMPVYLVDAESLNKLQQVLSRLEKQTFYPLEVVISVDTIDPKLHHKMLELTSDSPLNFKIIRNQNIPNASSNTNNAVMACTGDLIHILHQDDLLIEKFAYENIVLSYATNRFDWALLNRIGSPFDYIPIYHPGISLGFNNIGGPSVLVFEKENFIFLNSDYLMLCDVINYSAYFKKFGNPFFFRQIHIEFGQREDSFSKTISAAQVKKEVRAVFLSGEMIFSELVKLAFMDEYLTPHLGLIYKSIFSLFSLNFRRKLLLILLFGLVSMKMTKRKLARYANKSYFKRNVF